MEDDGFVLVKKGGRRKTINVARADGSLEDIESTMEKLTADADVKKMVDWCRLRLDSLLDSRSISRILLLGNGHFDAKWETGAHQLAFSLGLQSRYEAELLFQEPSCSAAEREWLSTRPSISLRSERDILIDPLSSNQVELVVLIHGLHSLLNDFLWHRWDSLEGVVFICNDYSQIDLIGGTQKLNEEYEALNVFREHAKVIRMPSYTPNPSAFSGTSLMYFEGPFPEISRKQPVYTNADG